MSRTVFARCTVEARAGALSWQRRAAALFLLIAYLTCARAQEETNGVAEANGIRAFFGIVPAALMDPTLLSHEPSRRAWGRDGPLPDAHHLLVALLDVETGVRIDGAVVEAVVIAPSGGGTAIRLAPLSIGDAEVYGGLFRLG